KAAAGARHRHVRAWRDDHRGDADRAGGRLSRMAVTLRFQSTGAVPGNARPVSMRGGTLTVGRGPDNDLVLPDPDKVISKRHCAIEEQNGSFVLIDLSANGTFLNYDKMPVGQTPARLHDGDILTMGAYELLV